MILSDNLPALMCVRGKIRYLTRKLSRDLDQELIPLSYMCIPGGPYKMMSDSDH